MLALYFIFICSYDTLLFILALATDIHVIFKEVVEEMKKQNKTGLISNILSHTKESIVYVDEAAALAVHENLSVNAEWYSEVRTYMNVGHQWILDEAEKMNESDCLVVLQGTFVRVVAKTRKAREQRQERIDNGPIRATEPLDKLVEAYHEQRDQFLNLLQWITNELLQKEGTSYWWGEVHQMVML